MPPIDLLVYMISASYERLLESLVSFGVGSRMLSKLWHCMLYEFSSYGAHETIHIPWKSAMPDGRKTDMIQNSAEHGNSPFQGYTSRTRTR